MIDFNQFHGIIPEKGSLILIMTRKNGTVFVTFAPKFKDAEKSQELAPIPLQGNPEELTEFFRKDIKDLTSLYEKVANLSKPSPSVRTRVEAKKTELSKKADAAGTTTREPEKKDSPAGPLFAASAAQKPEEKPPVTEEPKQETEETDLF